MIIHIINAIIIFILVIVIALMKFLLDRNERVNIKIAHKASAELHNCLRDVLIEDFKFSKVRKEKFFDRLSDRLMSSLQDKLTKNEQ